MVRLNGFASFCICLWLQQQIFTSILTWATTTTTKFKIIKERRKKTAEEKHENTFGISFVSWQCDMFSYVVVFFFFYSTVSCHIHLSRLNSEKKTEQKTTEKKHKKYAKYIDISPYHVLLAVVKTYMFATKHKHLYYYLFLFHQKTQQWMVNCVYAREASVQRSHSILNCIHTNTTILYANEIDEEIEWNIREANLCRDWQVLKSCSHGKKAKNIENMNVLWV